MAEYILDVSKWRCGDLGLDGETRLGVGVTFMLNDQGFMCCLGQFAKQMGVPDKHLMNCEVPQNVAKKLKNDPHVENPIYDPLFVERLVGDSWDFRCTPLTNKLIDINDNMGSTYGNKIDQIRELLESMRHTLKVINLP